MCNCISEILEVLKTEENKNQPDHMNVESVKFDNTVFSLTFDSVLTLPITFEINNTKTDKTKNKKSYVTMNYCPFCGEKYKSEEQ